MKNFLSLIGEGAFGEVYRALDVWENKWVAIKRLKYIFRNITEAIRAFREIYILRNLDHPNVIPLLDVIYDSKVGARTAQEIQSAILRGFGDLYLVFELMDTDLRQMIKSNAFLTSQNVKTIFKQILLGLDYIHSMNVIHRDLKPANILIRTRDGSLLTQIADFGLARVVYPEEAATLIYPQIEAEDSPHPSSPTPKTSVSILSPLPSSFPLPTSSFLSETPVPPPVADLDPIGIVPPPPPIFVPSVGPPLSEEDAKFFLALRSSMQSDGEEPNSLLDSYCPPGLGLETEVIEVESQGVNGKEEEDEDEAKKKEKEFKKLKGMNDIESEEQGNKGVKDDATEVKAGKIECPSESELDVQQKTTNQDVTKEQEGTSTSSSSSLSSSDSPHPLLRQLSTHVATRWYRAPEIVLVQSYGAASDVWAAGCVLAELIQMQRENSSSGRRALFPGFQCGEMSKGQEPLSRDQLAIILKLIGSPSLDELSWCNETGISDVSRVVRCLSLEPKGSPEERMGYFHQKLNEKFPRADSEALSLLRGLVSFDPRTRTSCQEAFLHPYLTSTSLPPESAQELSSTTSFPLPQALDANHLTRLEDPKTFPDWATEDIFFWRNLSIELERARSK